MATLPTIRVYGPAGSIIINEADLPAFVAQGYRTTKPPEPEAVPAPAEAPPQDKHAAPRSAARRNGLRTQPVDKE